MGIFKLIAGIAAIAAAPFTGGASLLGLSAAGLLVSAGAGLALSGIGTLIAGTQKAGSSSTQKNPIAPWEIPYGRCVVPGTLVYDQVWGADNNIRDLVVVVAACRIAGIDRMMFDKQFIQLQPDPFPSTPLTPAHSFGPSNSGPNNGGYAFTSISRANNVVTVVLANAIPFLQAGDQVLIQDTSGGTQLSAQNLIGKVQVAQILTSSGGNATSFTYLSGGSACSISGHGQCKTAWPNYGTNIYVEWTNGGGVPGQQGGTFVGMIGSATQGAGTPWLGTGQLINPSSPGPAGFGQGYNSGNPPTNPWNAFCSLQGKAAVFIRICGNTNLFPAGLPLISFLVRGKNDIYDPRLGPATGIRSGGFANNGSGYQAGDILSIAGGAGGQVQILSVSSTGQLSWKMIAPGVGYSVGGPNATSYVSHTSGSGSGTGATFNISSLGGSTGTLVYTENPALCIADYVSNRNWNDDSGDQGWGFGMLYGTEIPLTPLIAAANACDASQATAVPSPPPYWGGAAGTEPLFMCNGKFNLSEQRGAILRDLLTSCAGRYTLVGGQFVIWPGVWNGGSPTAVDLMAIASGPFEWKPTPVIRDVYNGVKGTYISPFNKWEAADFPYFAQDAFHGYSGPAQYGGDINLQADNGQRRWLDITLRFTISSRQAQQTAKIELLRRRNWGVGTFAVNMTGYNMVPLDILSATHAYLGWSAVALEVAKVRLRSRVVRSGSVDVPLLYCEVDVQQTNSDIYAWSTAEELTPQGYVQANWPQGEVLPSVCWPWSPGYVAPLAGDGVFPQGATGPATWGAETVYGIDAQGNATASLQIKGTPPINSLDTQIAKPQISCVGNTAGGSLPDGTYVVGGSARDSGSSGYSNTDYLALALAVISGGGGHGSITVTIANGSGDDGCDLYVALLGPNLPQFNAFNPNGALTFHWNQLVAPSGTSATITTFDQSKPGGPDPLFNRFGVTWMKVIHSGVWADEIVSVTPTTITFGANDMTANQWAGYILSCLAKYANAAEIPLLNLPVASSTASSSGEFTLTIGPNSDSVQVADLTTLLSPQDLMVCRAKYTFTSTGFSDPNVANGFFPTGDTPADIAGAVAVVLTGADAGDVQSIASVSIDGSGNYTVYTLSGAWQITPATGDIVVICDPTLAPEVPSSPISAINGSAAGGLMVTVPVLNLADQTWLFLVRTEDANGKFGADAFTPKRDLYIFGAGGTSPSITASGSMT